MRLTVVGCSGSYAGPDSPASCYLVEADGYRLVVDLGNGALGALQRLLDLDTVDAVLLSHLHADHCVDLTGWYVQRRYHPDGATRPPLPVYGPAGVARRISGAYDTPVSHLERAFAFREFGAGPLSLGPLAITLARVAHPVEAYAVRIEHGGRALVYSGDTGPCAALERLATGADVLLAEASFLDGHERGPRPPPDRRRGGCRRRGCGSRPAAHHAHPAVARPVRRARPGPGGLSRRRTRQRPVSSSTSSPACGGRRWTSIPCHRNPGRRLGSRP